MRILPSFVLALLLCLPEGAPAQEVLRFRQWIEGTETGGAEVLTSRQPERIDHREWTQLDRLGSTVRQEVAQTAVRSIDGAIHVTWRVSLSQEPMRGEADWSPKDPGRLRVTVHGGTPAMLEVPPGAQLWPGDADTALKAAAAARQSIHLTEFSPGTQQWARLELQPIGPDPLPGFPDTVRFRGKDQEGSLSAELEIWLSPSQGEVKQIMKMAGLTVLRQRSELPAPTLPAAGSGFFQRTLAQLPPHPFLPWIPEAVLRWSGPGRQELPQDPQQTRLDDRRYQVRLAAEPTPEEAAERPVSGAVPPEDAPFLAATPLLQFKDPVMDGLLKRLNPPQGASRWELARRVTGFVFEWIAEKDLSVGFASASEVARNGKGDCTEHGVLAVALLRKLGIPARGVVGWAGLGEVLGLHFWVEVKVGRRWIPVDPTFDQAPASALRLKLATTDLADLGSIGWDAAAMSFVDGTWVPEKPWAETTRIEGDVLQAQDGTRLRVPGGRWTLQDGRVQLHWMESHAFSAVGRPAPWQLKGARLLAGGRTGVRGWWSPGDRILWVDLGRGRWLQVDRMLEPPAFRFLDLLEIRP